MQRISVRSQVRNPPESPNSRCGFSSKMRAYLVILGLLVSMTVVGVSFGQTGQVVVISHRGEHLHHPENTIPAFRAAYEAGADFIELDLRTTSDGKLVLMHNDTVDARTNGSGAVKDMTFEQIRMLDAGIKSGQEFAGAKVPTFD